MSIPNHKIVIKANSVWSNNWAITNRKQTFDITGYGFKMELKSIKSPVEPAYLSLSLGNGIELIDPVEGLINLRIDPKPDIIVPTKFYYDLLIIRNNIPQVILEGIIEFLPGTTYVGE